MSIKVHLIDKESGKEYHSRPPKFVPDEGKVIVTSNEFREHGTFSSTTRTSAGTSTITSPIAGGAIVLSDIIISTDKVNNATLTVQFTDGSNTVSIFAGTATDAPINLALGLQGNWLGWADARIDMITTNALNATVAIGYFKIAKGQTFATWDAAR